MENGEDKIDDNLATIQKAIEAAAGEVPHCTEAEGEKNTQGTPENVRSREEAAARCTKVMKRRVLKKQARSARDEHLVKCCRKEDRRKKTTVRIV